MKLNWCHSTVIDSVSRLAVYKRIVMNSLRVLRKLVLSTGTVLRNNIDETAWVLHDSTPICSLNHFGLRSAEEIKDPHRETCKGNWQLKSRNVISSSCHIAPC